MSNAEARRLVAWHYEDRGYAVYLGAQAVGKRTMPDLVVVSRETFDKWGVRVMVGKRPNANGKLYHDPRRVGVGSDFLAIVNPEDGFITLSHCEPKNPQSLHGYERDTGSPPVAR